MRHHLLLLASLLLAQRAQAGDALDCLEASHQAGGLGACLGEAGPSAAAAVPVADSGFAPALQTGAPPKEPRGRFVPSPTGPRWVEDGTVEAGFFKGLDSGFDSVFAAIVSPALLGLDATGPTGAGSDLFAALGYLLAVPGWIVAGLVGAPLGAAAGVLAEKVSPGSTRDWFGF